MHKAESIVVVAKQIKAFAHRECCKQAVEIKIFINFSIAPSKYSHGNAANLEMSVAYVASVVRHHANQIALFHSLFNVGNSSGEHPWVKAEQRFFLASS